MPSVTSLRASVLKKQLATGKLIFANSLADFAVKIAEPKMGQFENGIPKVLS